MAWNVTFQSDEDKLDVGTATATWSDDVAGTREPFSVSRRIQLDAAGKAAFIKQAMIRLQQRDEKTTRDKTQAEVLTSELIAASLAVTKG